eukprot:COSAG05_NODE_5528_length_1150_cov_27.586108_1_plen_311_part_10
MPLLLPVLLLLFTHLFRHQVCAELYDVVQPHLLPPDGGCVPWVDLPAQHKFFREPEPIKANAAGSACVQQGLGNAAASWDGQEEPHGMGAGGSGHYIGSYCLSNRTYKLELCTSASNTPEQVNVQIGGSDSVIVSWVTYPNADPGWGRSEPESDDSGCLVTKKTGPGAASTIWVVHRDHTRSFVRFPSSGCSAKARVVSGAALDAVPKRHGPESTRYSLDRAQSQLACSANRACDARFPHDPAATMWFAPPVVSFWEADNQSTTVKGVTHVHTPCTVRYNCNGTHPPTACCMEPGDTYQSTTERPFPPRTY